MSEQIQPLDEATILEELRVLDQDVTQINAQIVELEASRDEKMRQVRHLYGLYSTRSLMVASVAGGMMEQNPERPKTDRRKENNPIKNINIGVNLSFRHSKSQGYDAMDALERATASIVKTAIGNGLHSNACPCQGRTDNCPETEYLVTDANSLPKAVQNKLHECFENYGKKKKAARKPKVMTA